MPGSPGSARGSAGRARSPGSDRRSGSSGRVLFSAILLPAFVAGTETSRRPCSTSSPGGWRWPASPSTGPRGPVIANFPIWMAEASGSTPLALPDESPADVLDLAAAFPGHATAGDHRRRPRRLARRSSSPERPAPSAYRPIDLGPPAAGWPRPAGRHPRVRDRLPMNATRILGSRWIAARPSHARPSRDRSDLARPTARRRAAPRRTRGTARIALAGPVATIDTGGRRPAAASDPIARRTEAGADGSRPDARRCRMLRGRSAHRGCAGRRARRPDPVADVAVPGARRPSLVAADLGEATLAMRRSSRRRRPEPDAARPGDPRRPAQACRTRSSSSTTSSASPRTSAAAAASCALRDCCDATWRRPRRHPHPGGR